MHRKDDEVLSLRCGNELNFDLSVSVFSVCALTEMKLSAEDFPSLLPSKVSLSCCALDASALNLLERLMNSVTDQPGHQPDIPYQPL